MAWHYYLENKIHFPFSAKSIAAHPHLVIVHGRGRNLAVPFSQLMPADPDPSTQEAVGNWRYWVAPRYLL
jgi:hypothetical protein